MGWIIVKEFPKDQDEAEMAWSNEEGFTLSDNYDTFTDEEKATMALPMGGVWVEVSWNVDRKTK